jgi:hypothetical protein
MATTTSRPPTAPLNLAALVAPLPPVTLPNGTTHALVFTAQAAELWKKIRHVFAALQRGESIDEFGAEDDIDACLAAVIPTATPDDLASFGTRFGVKLATIGAAAGRVDEVMQLLEAANANKGNGSGGEATPASSPDTTSATA